MLEVELESSPQACDVPPKEEAPNLEKFAEETDHDIMLARPGYP